MFIYHKEKKLPYHLLEASHDFYKEKYIIYYNLLDEIYERAKSKQINDKKLRMYIIDKINRLYLKEGKENEKDIQKD